MSLADTNKKLAEEGKKGELPAQEANLTASPADADAKA